MTLNILLAWIGRTDLRAASGLLEVGSGPIGQAAQERTFDQIRLLSDYGAEEMNSYRLWLRSITDAEIHLHHFDLSGPTEFDEIFEAARSVVEMVGQEQGDTEYGLVFHMSPGTPVMGAVWVILAHTFYKGEVIESSPEAGVRTVAFPFELTAAYLPDLFREAERDVVRLTQGLPPEASEFQDIVHRCRPMRQAVAQARRIAVYDVPVVIQGASGTGKELFARAIHASSSRKSGRFIAVNCGAIPENLVESELFGHIRGAFTGAVRDRKGYMEEADGGTLFLDEIGELSLAAQVKLLRAIQEGVVQKVGATKVRQIDIRIIAATNRNLLEAVADGAFRADLFHRIAVGVIYLPPLRDREADLDLLIDDILQRINEDFSRQIDWKPKAVTSAARKALRNHPWPGNVRELVNTLTRAAIWTSGRSIDADTVRTYLFPAVTTEPEPDTVLHRPLGASFALQDVMNEVVCHYLERALIEARGNRTQAAMLVGLPNYQTFTNWLDRYGVSRP